MQIKVLGPLEVHEQGKAITPSATKVRQVLALLATHAGQPVAVRTILEELWDSAPPHSSMQTLQTYVLQLRRRIAGAFTVPAATASELAKKVLVTTHGGYMLDIAAEDVDTHLFGQLAVSGGHAMAARDYETASRELAAALEMWRGPALVDVQTGSQLGAQVSRLEESRLGVLESRIEADLHLGRHYTLLGELAELTAHFPLHQQLWSQYMLAQYRSGRQWRALELFHRLRETMIAELGLEPSAKVRQLQQAILNSDPALDDSLLLRDLVATAG